MSKTIFISSTYRDLVPHREQMWKVLQNFDVRITGMEAFGARKSNPLETCLDEIDSSDIYLGIISMCYGSIDEISGKSYTQIEYEKAKERGLDILIYLIDESAGNVRTGHIDFGDKQLRLNSFKNILKKNHTVDFFADETDLGRKVFTTLENLLPTAGLTRSRPNSLECKVFRIKLNRTTWVIFVGYLNGKPLEIWSCKLDDEEGLLLPDWVNKGLLIYRKIDSLVNYDFSYVNRRGYKTTIEGINFLSDFQINTYDKIVTKLLKSNVHLSVVINAISDMNIQNKAHDKWNSFLIQILSNN